MSRLQLVDLRGRDVRDVALPRPSAGLDEAREAAAEVLAAVRDRGDVALRELTLRFDGVDVDRLEVPGDRLDGAVNRLDPDLRTATEGAVAQVRRFHELARPRDWESEEDGARFGQRYRPLARVGSYVPGGVSPLPSSVYMAAVPARVAGVDEVVLCSPPTGGDGWPAAVVLAVARLVGVDRVFRIGGAQAIAAMAYGTETVPAVDKIVGPGNAYTAAAKLLVQADGRCGIDGYAGPTEIAVIADDTADPRIVAADLVAQAEHDELASCLLVTTEPALVGEVEAALEEEVAGARHHERIAAALGGQGVAVLVDDLEAAVAVTDRFAPEHLEIQTDDPASVADRVRFAGAVFVGSMTPVSLGDYAAGPNHTLPTAGTARFRGGLHTTDFLVHISHVAYEAGRLAELQPIVSRMAAAEDLPAHARAVDVRVGRDGGEDA